MGKSISFLLFSLILVFVFAAIVLFFKLNPGEYQNIINFINYQRGDYKVEGNSMLPLYKDKEIIHAMPCSDQACKNSISRGDIVVFDAKKYDIQLNLIVKRVVGLPLDHIMISGGNVYVNESKIDEPYLTNTPTYLFLGFICTRFNLGTDQYFVLGDNREHSYDSRVFGQLYVNDIIAVIKTGLERPNSVTNSPEKIKVDEKDCPLWTKEMLEKSRFKDLIFP